MIDAGLNFGVKRVSTVCRTVSFIVSNVPFVGHTNTPILPFVGHNIPFKRFRTNSSGFTLIELLVTVTLVGILAALAGPSIRTMTLNNRLVSETNDLLADILYMRSEAIKRSKNIHMCKSTDVNVTQPVCNTTTTDSWGSGWIIWSDNDGSGALNYTGTTPDTLLRVGDGFSGKNNNIKTTTTTTTAGTETVASTNEIANELVISRLGLWTVSTTTSALSSPRGVFSICDSRGSTYGKRVEITTAGRPRVNKGTSPFC